MKDVNLHKRAGSVSSDPSFEGIANLLLNPLSSITPGEVYIPEFLMGNTKSQIRDVPAPFTGDTKTDQLMFRGGALAISMAAIAALARFSSQTFRNRKQDQEYKENLSSQVTGSNPIFSPDPYLNDRAEENKKRMLGVGGVRKKGSSKEAEVGWLEAIVPLALAGGGFAFGHKGADQYLDRRRKRKLQRNIDELSNELDRLNYIKLMKARGAADEDIPGALDGEDSPLTSKEAKEEKKKTERDPRSNETSGWDAPRSLTALAVLSTMVTSGILAKRYFDEEDPYRKEMKEVRHVLKNLQNTEQTRSPVSIAPLAPDLQRDLNEHLLRRKKAPLELPAARPVVGVPVDIPSRDVNDPTMAALL